MIFFKQGNKLFWLKLIGFMFFFIGLNSKIYAHELDLNDVVLNLTDACNSIASLIFAIANIAGLAFGISGIMKFKQHKDNPSMIQIGQPIALVLLSAVLLFLPILIQAINSVLFTAR